MVVSGLCLGSFINAFTWRLHEQEEEQSKAKPNLKYLSKLSIAKGHSICPNCKRQLSVKDLIPIVSWVVLRGKCRYCHKPISWQYPVVELITAVLFIGSYVLWPEPIRGIQIAIFVLWLIILVGLIALVVYDLRWLLLPNKIIYSLYTIAFVQAIIIIANSNNHLSSLADIILAVIVGGGLFYALFQISNGKWIGGGDVKLGGLLGLIAATPGRSFLLIFLATLLGSLVSVPLLLSGRLKKNSIIPFGPFLIIGAIIVQFYGQSIISWYQNTFIF